MLVMAQAMHIRDLAEEIVWSIGRSLRDVEHLDGALDFICTCLCSGQKFYEGLLIDPESKSTIHSIIYRVET